MPEQDRTLLRIGLNIRMRRHIMKLTQKELARRMGCSDRRICHIEHGRIDLPVDALLAFARALECSLQDLMLGT